MKKKILSLALITGLTLGGFSSIASSHEILYGLKEGILENISIINSNVLELKELGQRIGLILSLSEE